MQFIMVDDLCTEDWSFLVERAVGQMGGTFALRIEINKGGTPGSLNGSPSPNSIPQMKRPVRHALSHWKGCL